MRTNMKPASPTTHEGAQACHIGVVAQLRRSVLSCLLWESEFYEDGQEIGKRIAELTAQCLPNVASNRNGVGYGKWLHVDGWSDAVVRFIAEHERMDGARE